MTRRVSTFSMVVVGLTCLFVCGCSGGTKRPPMGKVRGTLTHKNEPVANAVITFMKEGSPRGSTGITDAKGNFKLTTYDTNDGAFLGSQKVIVTMINMNPTGAGGGGATMDSEALAKIVSQGKFEEFMKKNKAESKIPAKYGDMKTTPLQYTIEAGDNQKDIELED